MAGFIGALDQGTTSTRFMLFTAEGDVVSEATYQVEHEQIKPESGWFEHDPMEILNKSIECIDGCMGLAKAKGITPGDVKAIGITNQRETTVVWDKETGEPLYNAIVWKDLRTAATSDNLRKTISEKRVTKITGLPISSYFSGVKLRWLLDNVPAVAEAVANGSALFGTIDTWLMYHLANKIHVTDVTNAGRTMMMNLVSQDWDDRMLASLGVPRNILPEIKSCSEVYGNISCTALKGVPIAGIVGDQQAALIGQAAFEPGKGKTTYGTGIFLVINTGTTLKYSKYGLLTTPAYKLGPDALCHYCLEGSVSDGGAAVRWLEQIGVISSAKESGPLAASVPDTGGVSVVPAFSGLKSPRWREDARGIIVGITDFTTKAHIARATLAGLTHLVDDIVVAAGKDMGGALTEMRVDGGATSNEVLLQMQSDVLGIPVVRPTNQETTALGAAFAAGMAVKFFHSTDDVVRCWQKDKTFEPVIDDEKRAMTRCTWERAVERSVGWATLDCKPGLLSRFEDLVKSHPIAVVTTACAISSAVGFAAREAMLRRQ